MHRELGATSIYVTHDQEEAMALGDRIAVMYGGELLQCASPREVYEQPVNRFVAGFVGVPPMNFLDGRIVEKDGQIGFDTGVGVLGLPIKAHATLASYCDQAMVYGVRPQGVRVGSPGTGAVEAAGRVEATVVLVEMMGRESDVYLQCRDGQQLTARVPSENAVTEGDTVGVSFDVENVHVFEPGENGMNVTYSGQSGAGLAELLGQAVAPAGVDASAN